mgnify:CR=1 FL=1
MDVNKDMDVEYSVAVGLLYYLVTLELPSCRAKPQFISPPARQKRLDLSAEPLDLLETGLTTQEEVLDSR